MKSMKRAFVVASLMLFAASCGGDKKKDKPAAKKPAGAECTTTAECEAGHVCLNDVCSATSSGAILKNPGNAVTPAKVKKQLDDIGKKREKRIDGVTP